MIGVFVFLRERKEALVRECVRLIEKGLSQSSQTRVKIGRVRGNLLGFIRFENVEVGGLGIAESEPPAFKIQELELRFRFLDFLSKRFDSKIVLIVKNPEVRWKPYLGIRVPQFPIFGWMREWASSQKSNFLLKVEGLSLSFEGYKPFRLSGINAQAEGETFHMELPVSHVPMGRSDVTSVIVVDGKFDPGPRADEDILVGRIHTEGTVIDWKPVSQESVFNFVFTQEAFRLSSANFVGGIQIDGQVDFTNDYELSLSIYAKDVPMRELGFFLKLDKSLASAGRFDLEVNFEGNFLAPQMEAHARIYDGFIGARAFKMMDLNAEGVYPTVRLNNSRILLEDGSTMRLADDVLEIGDLLRSSTFHSLISGSQQDTVVWGDWEFSRPTDDEARPEFLMQRLFGEHARVHFKKMNEDPEEFQDRRSQDMEVGFEYKLRSENSLKLEYRDDQEVVGVIERKSRF